MDDNIRNHKFIVFCVDHYNPLGICRSLGEEGVEPVVVLVGNSPSLINHCRYVKVLHLVKAQDEGLNLIVEKYGSEPLKPFLLTGSDDITELLDQHYDELINKFYFFNCGSKGATAHFMDKEVICDVAQKCGIDKPKGEILKRGELPKNLNYPIITKVTMSIKGGWKKDVHICQNDDELVDAWKTIMADEILAQEYIVKKNELCIDGFSINGGEEVWFPNTSEYIRFTDEGYGNYMWIKPYNDIEVRSKIHNIIRSTCFSGIFSVECLIDKNDNLHFLEMNFRNSTWSYAYTYAGLNLPYQWAKSTLAGHIDFDSCKVRTTPFTAMAEFEDFAVFVKNKRQVPLRQWFKEFHNSVCFTYNKKDKKPFYYFLLHKVVKQFNR